jgi:hypothetical protein
MDGLALMDKVPGLAVDAGRSQSGRFQFGINFVRDLLQALAVEAL